jgi:hypothetical protein
MPRRCSRQERIILVLTTLTSYHAWHSTCTQRTETPFDSLVKANLKSLDSSFASHSDAKGHSGYAIFIDDISAAIACKSIKRRSVAHSSMEAELIALHDMLRHILWVRDIADELHIRKNKTEPIRIGQDNVPAINAVSSDMGSLQGRSKFIDDRRLFTVHEYIANGQIEVYHCRTDDMVADLLTKSIIGRRAHRFQIKFMGTANELTTFFRLKGVC